MDSATTLWIPPLSPKKQKQLKRRRKQPLQNLRMWANLSEKGLWDWLQLLAVLAVPIAITIGTMWFSAQQGEANLRIANDQQQETALQTYLDRMSDLLLNNKLRESHSEDAVREVARSRTLTVLPLLNSTRKGELVHFLKEASLIEKQNAIVSLLGADLRGAALNDGDLSNADLIGTDLSNA